MINTSVRIHDKFSVEFKIGFLTSQENRNTDKFKINTWIFIPNGLDINRHTYSKETFYSDVKSNIRLITPSYSLQQILNGRGPFPRLKKAIEEYLTRPDEETEKNYLYHVKMLLCILKSTYRNNARNILCEQDTHKRSAMIRKLIEEINAVNRQYRIQRDEILLHSEIPQKGKEYFLFGDEYLGSITEENIYLLLREDRKHNTETDRTALLNVIRDEIENKRRMGYIIPSEDDKEHNSLMLIQRSILKKFVESNLYLQRVKKADGAIAREFYYSIAAGIAMIFATVVTFAATQRFGNFTMALFFALVLSYMFKDRIKEAARFYFSSKLDQKYFDWKWDVSVNNRKIGWIKEAFDFISQDKVPENILKLRKKTPLVEAENEVYDEKVILYRKRVFLEKDELTEVKQYHFSGINDIFRLNLTSLTKKMDNPEIPIYVPGGNDFRTILGNRAYALYFIIESESEGDTSYKSYRLLFNRNGISSVAPVSSEQ